MKCKYCGYTAYPGEEYCRRCSGQLYRKRKKKEPKSLVDRLLKVATV